MTEYLPRSYRLETTTDEAASLRRCSSKVGRRQRAKERRGELKPFSNESPLGGLFSTFSHPLTAQDLSNQCPTECASFALYLRSVKTSPDIVGYRSSEPTWGGGKGALTQSWKLLNQENAVKMENYELKESDPCIAFGLC